MFIRETKHQDKKTQKEYSTFKLVESVRTEKGPRQQMLLNLGSHFKLPRDQWKDLTDRIELIVKGQEIAVPYSKEIEVLANRYSKQLLKKQALIVHDSSEKQEEFHDVDVLSLKHNDVKTVGAEHVMLSMIRDLELDKQLKEMGINKEQVQLAIGSIVNRAISPGSERHADYWLKNQSALEDLTDFDFGGVSLYKMYKISDILLESKRQLESHLAGKEKSLFNLEETLILYDLTNTYFEGSAKQNPKANFGRSKEKRRDCPLVTMGLTLNAEGFPKKSEFFAGNVSEGKTLAMMVESMRDNDLTSKPIVVMDAGIAREENIIWLIENGFEYLVVSRKAQTSMPEGVVTTVVKDKPNNIVESAIVDVENQYYDGKELEKISNSLIPQDILDKLGKLEHEVFSDKDLFRRELKKVIGKDELEKYQESILESTIKTYQEKELYCFSEARAKKEEAMKTQVQSRFEKELKHLSSGLTQKGRLKNYEKVTVKVGRLKEKYKRISSHYEITVKKEKESEQASSVTWALRTEKIDDRFSGVYCLRSSVKDMDEKTLWKTYVMLTEVEAAFRCMKSELGLRPVHHQLEHRVDGHLFITLLAYHVIHCIRFRLKRHGINESWTTIRERLSTQVRLTTSMNRKDGKLIHIRKSSEANAFQRKIYKVLGLPLNPGKTEKTILGDK